MRLPVPSGTALLLWVLATSPAAAQHNAPSPHGAPPSGSPHNAPSPHGAPASGSPHNAPSPHGAPPGAAQPRGPMPQGAPPGAAQPGVPGKEAAEEEMAPASPHGMGIRTEALPWQPEPTVKQEDIDRAAQSALDERWTAPDGHFSLRPPLGWIFSAPKSAVDGGEAPPGELGRFVAPDAMLGGSLRVGYVQGPIVGTAEELRTVMKNVAPRWQLMGMQTLPTEPTKLVISGHDAVLTEMQLKPVDKAPEGAPPPTIVYAYINNGTDPGIMVQVLVNPQHLPHLRGMLRASLQSMMIEGSSAAELSTTTDGTRGPPPWLWAPAVLAAGLALALRLRSGKG